MTRRLAIAALFIASISAIAVVIGPPIIARRLAPRAAAALASRGIVVAWSDIDASITGGFYVRDVTVRAAAWGLHARLASVTGRIDWSAALRGQVHLPRLDLRGAEVELELGVDHASRGPAISAGTLGRASELGGLSFDAVRVEGWALVVHRNGGALTAASGIELQAEPRANGRVVFFGDALAQVARADVTIDDVWNFEGDIELAAQRGRVRVDPARAGQPIAVWSRGAQWASFGGLELRADLRAQTAELSLIETSARLGHRGVEAVFRHPRLVAEWREGEAVLRGEGGRLSVTGLPPVAKDGGQPASAGAAADAHFDPVAIAWSVAVDLSDLGVQWRPGGPTDARYFSLDAVAVRWKAGDLLVDAGVGEGAAELTADIVPGRWRPTRFDLDVRGIDTTAWIPLLWPGGPPVGGRFDASLHAAAMPDARGSPIGETMTVGAADIRWRDGRIDIPAISELPIEEIDLRLAADLNWRPDVGRLRLDDGRGVLGNLRVRGHVTVEGVPDDPIVELRSELEPTRCHDVVRSLPRALLWPYAAVQMEGELTGGLDLWWPIRRPATLELDARDLLRDCRVSALNGDSSAWPEVTLDGRTQRVRGVDWLERPFVKTVTEGVREGARIRIGPGHASYVPLNQLPGYVAGAAYLSEEAAFYRGGAINSTLATRAIRLNLEHGRYVYGGSTVTQQLVKNLFLTRKKTLARKFQEALVASRIVQSVAKSRVLGLYLNCIEFGPNVYGIGRAARYYFGKDARQLTPTEAVFLAMLKPAPRRGAAIRRRGTTPEIPYWRDRAGTIFRRLIEHGLVSEVEARAAWPWALHWDAQGNYLGPKPRPDGAAPPDPLFPPPQEIPTTEHL